MERFSRKITKSGTVYAITIPNDIAYRLGISRGSNVLIEIRYNNEVLYRDVKKVSAVGKQLAIILPKRKAFDKIWTLLYEKGVHVDVSIDTVDNVVDSVS